MSSQAGSERLTVMVLGADGYIGWPMAMHLSQLGHRVIAVDNLSRRRWDREGGTYSLVPLHTMSQRVRRWGLVSGRQIEWRRADLRDFTAVD
ncbi:MAG: NAD-dependent epimerase/dehydratase family protein, partial [Candidatus Dormibacteria bacterium]